MENKLLNENSSNDKPSPRVALIVDWIYGGGAEKVVLEMHKLYPEAPIYTSYCSDEWQDKLGGKVVTGYLQRSPFRQLRKFLPLLRQWWFAHLNLSDYDIIISITGNGEAKFALPQPPATNYQLPNVKRPLHISYCHTPVHYYWRHYQEYLRHPGFKPKWLARLGLRLLVKPLRSRDYAAAQEVDYFIANSSHIQSDIKKYYNRDSVAIFPPVDTDRFTQLPPTAYQPPTPRSGFVTMGRQVPLKRTELIIQACNQLELPLKVIGRGPEHERLRKLAGPTISLETNVSDEQMPQELASAEAFIFASFEDFGIAPIEAMASGTPVIAYQAGGALDYVVPGQTGEFFAEQTVESLVSALQAFNPLEYDSQAIAKHATNFSESKFRHSIHEFVTNLT